MRRRNPPDEELDEELTIRPLEVPDFRPMVRPEEADGLSTRDRRLVLAVSVIEQQLNFLIETLVAANVHSRMIERRVLKSEKWRRKVSGPLNVIVWLGTAAAPFVIARLFDK